MAPNDNDGKAQVADAAEKAKEKNSKVADYLQAPRRKRKSYVLMAFGKSVKEELSAGIETFLRVNYKGVALASPKTPEELFKNFSRQIAMLLFDDEFAELEQGLEMINELKRRKSATVIPVLFFTRQPERLIEAYQRKLAAFHETDDYINYARSELNVILSKVRFGLVNNNRRRSRRYNVDLTTRYYVLGDETLVPDDAIRPSVKVSTGRPGRLLDLSIHGALLKAEDDRAFKEGEQVKLHVPVTEYLSSTTAGDVMKLSARVRRVFINGSQAGISFEYMSDAKLLTLTQFLTEMVNDQMNKRAMAAKARASRT